MPSRRLDTRGVRRDQAAPAASTTSSVRRDDLRRLELVGRLVDREADDRTGRVLRVAVLVDRERAEQAVRDLRLEHLGDHVSTRSIRVLDRVQQDLRRLCAVDRIRVDPGAVEVVRLERRRELLGNTRELVDRHARDGHEHARRRRARVVDRLLRREAVRCEQLDVTVVRPEHGDLVLDHLGAVLVDQAAEEDGVRPGRLDLLEQRLVARRLRIPRLEADDLDVEELGRLAGRGRDAEAVGLLVVQDVHLRDALILHELRDRRALVVVSRGDARVVPRSRRVVLVGLGRVTAARQVDRQARIRVRRRDHRDPTVRRLVQHRDDDRRATGVERADDSDHLVVRRVVVGVLRALARVPLAGLGGCVVARLEADVVVAGLVLAIRELLADRVVDLQRLRARGALQRQIGSDDVIRVPVALVLDRRARRRRKRLGRLAAVVPTAARRDEREGDDEQTGEEQPIPLELQAHPPPWWTDRGPARRRVVPLRGGECNGDAATVSERRHGAPQSTRRMPKVGLEPTRPRGQRILSPPRLPVPPLRPATGMVEAPCSGGWRRFSHDEPGGLV